MRSWVLAAGLLAAAAHDRGAGRRSLRRAAARSLRLGLRGSALRGHLQISGAEAAAPYAVPPPRPVSGPPPYAGPPIPRERVYRDDDYGYDRDYLAGPRRYSYADPRRALRRPLRAARAGQGAAAAPAAGTTSTTATCGATIATVHARRPSGRLFVLAIDRCSGEIVSAEPLEGRAAIGPYAYGPPPRRWDRAY